MKDLLLTSEAVGGTVAAIHMSMECKDTNPMDVANTLHLPPESDYESDITPEGVEFMRRRAAPRIEGETWTHVDSRGILDGAVLEMGPSA